MQEGFLPGFGTCGPDLDCSAGSHCSPLLTAHPIPSGAKAAPQGERLTANELGKCWRAEAIAQHWSHFPACVQTQSLIQRPWSLLALPHPRELPPTSRSLSAGRCQFKPVSCGAICLWFLSPLWKACSSPLFIKSSICKELLSKTIAFYFSPSFPPKCASPPVTANTSDAAGTSHWDG